MFFDKNNNFTKLYICDSESDEEESIEFNIKPKINDNKIITIYNKKIKIYNKHIIKTKIIYKCLDKHIKHFSRKSSKNKMNICNHADNNKHLELENNEYKVLYDNMKKCENPLFKKYFENSKIIKLIEIIKLI